MMSCVTWPVKVTSAVSSGLTFAVALRFAAQHRFCALLCCCRCRGSRTGVGVGVGGVRQILHAETPQFVWQDPLTLERDPLGSRLLWDRLQRRFRPQVSVGIQTTRQWPCSEAPGQHKTKNVQSLHYLCCNHDCGCGSNIESLSPIMHQCVTDFLLCLADIFIHVLKQLQKSSVISLAEVVGSSRPHSPGH